MPALRIGLALRRAVDQAYFPQRHGSRSAGSSRRLGPLRGARVCAAQRQIRRAGGAVRLNGALRQMQMLSRIKPAEL